MPKVIELPLFFQHVGISRIKRPGGCDKYADLILALDHPTKAPMVIDKERNKAIVYSWEELAEDALITLLGESEE